MEIAPLIVALAVGYFLGVRGARRHKMVTMPQREYDYDPREEMERVP